MSKPLPGSEALLNWNLVVVIVVVWPKSEASLNLFQAAQVPWKRPLWIMTHRESVTKPNSHSHVSPAGHTEGKITRLKSKTFTCHLNGSFPFHSHRCVSSVLSQSCRTPTSMTVTEWSGPAKGTLGWDQGTCRQLLSMKATCWMKRQVFFYKRTFEGLKNIKLRNICVDSKRTAAHLSGCSEVNTGRRDKKKKKNRHGDNLGSVSTRGHW